MHVGILEVLILGLRELNIHVFDNPIIGIPIKFVLVLFISIMLTKILNANKYLKKII